MAGTTPLGFPYPSTTDTPHGPNQIQALALAVDAQIQNFTGDVNLVSAAKVRWNAGDTEIARRAAGQLTTPGMALFAPPYFHGYQSVTQSLTTAVPAAVTLGGEIIDNAAGHSNVTTNTRYIPPIPGYYECHGSVLFNVSTTGDRTCNFRLNGAQVEGTPYGAMPAMNGAGFLAGCALSAPTTILCNGTTDYIELWALHNHGSNLDTFISGFNKSTVVIRWVGHP
jgi:hypothetical protein